MASDRKPLAVMIALRAKKPGADRGYDDGDEDEMEDSPPDEGRVAACEDMIDALKARDSMALDKALANWCQLYGHDKD